MSLVARHTPRVLTTVQSQRRQLRLLHRQNAAMYREQTALRREVNRLRRLLVAHPDQLRRMLAASPNEAKRMWLKYHDRCEQLTRANHARKCSRCGGRVGDLNLDADRV